MPFVNDKQRRAVMAILNNRSEKPLRRSVKTMKRTRVRKRGLVRLRVKGPTKHKLRRVIDP